MLSAKIRKELKNIKEYNFNQGKIFTGEEVYAILEDYLPEVEKLEALNKEMLEALKRNAKIYCDNCPDDCKSDSNDCDSCFVLQDYKLIEKSEKELK
jgi:hypothetical protein